MIPRKGLQVETSVLEDSGASISKIYLEDKAWRLGAAWCQKPENYNLNSRRESLKPRTTTGHSVSLTHSPTSFSLSLLLSFFIYLPIYFNKQESFKTVNKKAK
jgi:hypothetical protein